MPSPAEPNAASMAGSAAVERKKIAERLKEAGWSRNASLVAAIARFYNQLQSRRN